MAFLKIQNHQKEDLVELTDVIPPKPYLVVQQGLTKFYARLVTEAGLEAEENLRRGVAFSITQDGKKFYVARSAITGRDDRYTIITSLTKSTSEFRIDNPKEFFGAKGGVLLVCSGGSYGYDKNNSRSAIPGYIRRIHIPANWGKPIVIRAEFSHYSYQDTTVVSKTVTEYRCTRQSFPIEVQDYYSSRKTTVSTTSFQGGQNIEIRVTGLEKSTEFTVYGSGSGFTREWDLTYVPGVSREYIYGGLFNCVENPAVRHFSQEELNNQKAGLTGPNGGLGNPSSSEGNCYLDFAKDLNKNCYERDSVAIIKMCRWN